MNLSEVQYKNWQISNAKPGEIVEGIADVNQCVINIINTKKGTDPLRPDFGTDIFNYIDTPITTAAPNIQREILEGLTAWEQRITAIQVLYELREAGIEFFVNWSYDLQRATTKVKLIQVPDQQSGPKGVGYWRIEFEFKVS